ncbi:MAG: hypothetical protein M3Z20_17280 [Chloroflexota bacterium]|nr:hypothetical protein [Chloroflexota bacterium]
MRNRLILAGLGILLIVAAALVFSVSRLEPPPPAASALVEDHDHAAELLPPAPVGRTLFGGNSGELRASPAAIARATPAIRDGMPVAMPSLEVFAPARFQATPESRQSEHPWESGWRSRTQGGPRSPWPQQGS